MIPNVGKYTIPIERLWVMVALMMTDADPHSKLLTK